MEQRPLRLGDMVDDYCPRERRLTNHAVVAIVGDSIRQTRCTTCEAEHPYKEGKVPRRKKKDPNGELYDQVLAGVTGQLVVRDEANETADEAADETNDASPPVEALVPPVGDTEAEVRFDRPVSAAPSHRAPSSDRAAATGNGSANHQHQAVPVIEPPTAAGQNGQPQPPRPPEPPEHDEYWPAHRRLIRATLPRPEGQQPAPRPIPEFTMRQPSGRGAGSFRGGQGWSDRGGNGGGENRGNTRGAGGGFRQGKFAGGGGGRPGPGGGRPNRPGGGRPKRSR